MVRRVRLKQPGDAEQMEIVETELPPPGPDEIRLHQTAIGVNFIDIYQRKGYYPLQEEAIPGVEAAGVVAAVGTNVSTLKVGDRVAYAGTRGGAYATERNLPAWRALKLSVAFSDSAAASSLLKGLAAHMLLHRVHPVAAGDTLLVHSAAGGLGQLMTRWAVHLGATVIGTVGSDAKAAIAHAAGARHVIVGRDIDFVGIVRDLTSGRGVDAAYDGVGGATLARTLACVRLFGTAASIGQSGGAIPPLDVNDIGPVRSLSFSRPSIMAYVADPAEYRFASEQVMLAQSQGILTTEGTAYDFADVVQVHRDLEGGRTSSSVYLVP